MGDQDRPIRKTRHIQPLGPRVLVRVIKDEDRHESGLFLPPGAKDNLAEAFYGEVVEVARATGSDDLGVNVSGVPCGARVLFPKDEGVKVPWDDDLRVLEVGKILALVEEVSIEEIH